MTSQELSTLHPTLPKQTSRSQHEAPLEPLEAATTIASLSRADYTFPEGGTRAWLVIAGSFCIISGTFGLMSTVGIYSAYWQEHQLSNYTSRDIGWIAAVNVFLYLFLGVQIGPLFDRYGPRYILLIGSIIHVISIFASASSSLYWQFMLSYGILGGISGACLTTTALAVIAHWFERKRGFASGIALVGSSVGGVVFPMTLRSAFPKLGWGWGVRIIGFIVLVQMVVGNLMIRGRLPKTGRGGAVSLRCFGDARFSWATIGIALFEFVLFAALGLIPTWSIGQGFHTGTHFNIIASMNAGSAFGRTISGFISDRLGRYNTMLLTLAFSIFSIFALWLPVGNKVALFYVFAPCFGFGSGSIISMAPVCLGQLCEADQYGRYYGTSYSVVAFATLICIPVGGELLPTFGPEGFVAFFGGVLILSLASFLLARWACLDYKWKWAVRV